jgi:ribosome recycling factor
MERSIRVPVPALTEERRRDMVKHLNRVLEEHRTAMYAIFAAMAMTPSRRR